MNHKLPIALSFALFVAPANSAASTPTFIPLEGHLTDAGGNAVEGARDVSLALYTERAGGSPVYSETHSRLEIEGGSFFAYLGEGATDGELNSDLVATQGELWLEVTIDGIETIAPRFAIGTVPFALVADQCAAASHALTAGRADSAIVASEATTAQSAARAEEATYALTCETASRATRAESADDATKLAGKPATAYTYTAGSGVDVTSNAISVRTGGITASMLEQNLTYGGDLTVAGQSGVSPGGTAAAFRVKVGDNQLLLDADDITTTHDSLDLNRANPDSAVVVHGPMAALQSIWAAGYIQLGHVRKTCNAVNDCDCPAGTNLLSGGAVASPGANLQESHPTSERRWTARDSSGSRVPRSVSILCARIAGDPAF